ncbi:MAG: DUF1816 domain-containing protein [Snowella sp.]
MMAINNELNDQIFLLEVVIVPQASVPKHQKLTQRRGKFFLKVSSERMSQEIRSIHRLGGKILSIAPTSTLNGKPQALAWWLEVYTDFPRCLYYFGPFDSAAEAESHQPDYLEDLRQEGAENILAQIKQCQPFTLTQEW